MKAHFKYSILTGMSLRAVAFGFIVLMDLVFIILGSTVAPFEPLMITAVALGGVAIGAMTVFNVISDVSVFRRMFSAPGAYIYALTPAPRWKILISSVVTVAIMDIVTTAAVITGEVWLSLILAGESIPKVVREAIRGSVSGTFPLVLSGILALTVGYILLISVILFAVTVKRSIFYRTPASGLLSFLVACGCFYAVSLLQLLLAPFGTIERLGFLFSVSLTGVMAMPMYALLTLIEAVGLLTLTARLMERKLNI